MFYMCVPLADVTESYAQLFVIFDKFNWSVFKYQLRINFKIFKSNYTASVLRGLNSTNHCMAQLESIMIS